MATTIAKTSIGISANATEAITEMERLASKSKLLEKSVKELPQVGEKAKAAFSQIGQVSNVFSTMASDADGLTKTITGVSGAVSAMTVALQFATTVTKGLKAALLSSGIGAIILGLGYLASKIAEGSSSGGGGSGPEASRSRIADATRSYREGATGGLTAGEAAIAEGTATVERLRRAAGELRHIADERTARAVADMDRRASEARPMLAESVTARETFRGTSRLVELEEARTRARDLTATLGMSAEAADEYSLSLRRTTRTIGGVTVATTESLSPIEAHNRRMLEFADIERRTGADMTRARAESLTMMVREVATLEEVRRARLAAAGSAETERLISPMERLNRELERMGDLVMRGGTSFETYMRGVTATIGDVRNPLERTRDRVAEIGRAWEEAGTMAVLMGEEFDDTAFRRATGSALAELAGRGAPEISAPSAIMEGSAGAVSAINAARRAGSDDPAERAARSLEFVRRSAEATERHQAELVRLLGEGRITL